MVVEFDSKSKPTRGSRRQHRPVYLEMKYIISMRNDMLLRQAYSTMAGMAASETFHSLLGALMPKAAVKILAPALTPSSAEVILGQAERVVDGIFGCSMAFLFNSCSSAVCECVVMLNNKSPSINNDV